jgi:acetate kinase
MSMQQKTLVALNCGSSSVKYAVFDAKLDRLDHGMFERLGTTDTPRLRRAGQAEAKLKKSVKDHTTAIRHILEELVIPIHGKPSAVGHRVVHGGDRFTEPVGISPTTLSAIEALSTLAPEHQPHSISGINAVSALFPALPQVACFDTSFHAGIPRHRKLLPLPRHYAELGLKRYGFHGLSYEYLVSELLRHLGNRAHGKIILCHLGNGCSLAAIDNFECQHTTMGFTPLDGLVMGQRPGRLDPGAVLWLLEHHKGDIALVRKILNQQSGLLGISGASADMRTLLATTSPDAELAVTMFVDRLVQEIAAASAVLGGVDAIVFSGGIGENAASVRFKAMTALNFLGVMPDASANAQHAALITRATSRVSAHVIATNEELTIARATLELLNK